MECQSSTTADSRSEGQTLSGVDEDTVMISGLGDEDNGLEINGQHAVPSQHQVDKLLILPCEFEDSNQIIDVELFTDRSSPISHVNDVTLKRASDPNSIEGYREVIDEQHRSLKTLHLTLAENKRLIGCLQADLTGVPQELEGENSKRRQWETKFHRVNREVRGSRGLRADNRTEFQNSTEMGKDERRLSMSSGPTTTSRQFDRRPAEQRRGTTFPSDNMYQTFHGVRRDVPESQWKRTFLE